MGWRAVSCVSLVAALFLAGCFRLVHNADGPAPVALHDPAAGERADWFFKNEKGWWLFTGLIAVDVPRTEEILEDLVRGRPNARITDLRIESRMTVLDGIIFVLTSGIVAPMTVRLEGRIVESGRDAERPGR